MGEGAHFPSALSLVNYRIPNYFAQIKWGGAARQPLPATRLLLV